MAVHDAKYFKAIYDSIYYFYKNRLATVHPSTKIYKYYDLLVLKNYAPASLHEFNLSDHNQFDRLIDYLYNFQIHPQQEPEELKRLRDDKNPQVFLTEGSIKEREDINNLPPKEQAAAVSQWANTQAPPSAPKQPKVVRIPKEQVGKAKEEAKEREEVPKEQAAQQPQEQPPSPQPSQPATLPSMPHPPAGGPSTPGISISRRVPLSRETEEAVVKQRAQRAPSLFRRGFQGLGRGIGPVVGGLGNSFLSNGGKLLNSGANAIQRLGGLRSGAAANLKKAASRRVIWVVLLLLLGGGLIGGLLPGGILNPQPSLPGEIASCKFTRGDQPVQAVAYRSPLLLSYFQEASQKTSIPSSVLAAFTRVESPGSTEKTDQQILNDQCSISPTGALGIMQLQPPKHIHDVIYERLKNTPSAIKSFEEAGAHSADSIRNGANLLSINYEDLTEGDFCDARKSVLMGAGFILKKMQGYKYGDGTKWDPVWTTDKSAIDALVNGYYGCIKYPSCSSGPQSYSDDVFKSISECSLRVPVGGVIADASCPIPGGKIGCASYGKSYSENGFSGACAPDSAGNGGHCSNIYQSRVGICLKREEGGNLIRTAKSIDVSAGSKAGDPVYLPTINGQSLDWEYVGPVSAGNNFGWIRLFHTVNAKDGIWSIHFVHVNEGNPPLKIGDIVKSGQVGATILNPWIPGDPWPHAHITAGLNVEDSLVNLQDYNPNWKFPDRELGMCTK